MSKTKKLFAELMENVCAYSIVDFLYDEVKAFLSSLTYYKLATVQKNFSDFMNHVCGLSEYYFEKLEEIEGGGGATGGCNLHVTVGTIQNAAKIQLINEVRSFFLLSAIEFAQGSSTRIAIKNQMKKIMQKEGESSFSNQHEKPGI